MNCIIDNTELRQCSGPVQLSTQGIHMGPLTIRLDTLLPIGDTTPVSLPALNPPDCEGMTSIYTEAGVVMVYYPDGSSEVLFDQSSPLPPPVGESLGYSVPERVFLAAVPFVTTPNSMYDRPDLYYMRLQGNTLVATDSRSLIALPVAPFTLRYLLPMPTDGPVVLHANGQVSGKYSLSFQQPTVVWPQLPFESKYWPPSAMRVVEELPEGITVLPEEERRIRQSLRGQDYTIELRNENTPIVYRGADRSIMIMPRRVE
jgi:hypothetical protein